MREEKSERGMDGALERSLDSAGRNSEGVEKRLGRDDAPMSRGRKNGGRKSKRSASSRRGSK